MKLFIGNGVLAHNFIYHELIIGILIPAILLIIGRFKTPLLSALAGACMVVGLFFSRFDAIVGGQLLTRGSTKMDFTLHSYHVSNSELSIFIGGLGVALLVFFLGGVFLNLEEEAHQ